MFRSLTILAFLAPLSYAERGPTAIFEKENAAYWKSLGRVSDEKLQIRWVQQDEQWLCLFESDSKGKAVVAETGERVEVPTEPSTESKKPKDQDNQGKNTWVKPPADWKEAPREGWVWGERVLWNLNKDYFLALEIRDVEERQVHYVRSSPEDQLQPKYFSKNYPKPGDELRDRVPVVFSKDGTRIEVDPDLIANPFSVGNWQWRDHHRLWFEYIERGFGKFRLLELDVISGKTRVVAAEEDKKFLHVYEKCGWWDLENGLLLWRSEADGWSHLCTIDAKSGARKQLTSGRWVVRGVESVRAGQVLFRLSGFHPEQDPYHIHFARLDVASGKMTLLTHGDGTHELMWAPDGSYYVARYSRVDLPPVHELRRGKDGALVTVLAESSADGIIARGFHLPERFVTTDREGRYPIHGVIWKPRDFDPEKKYPVLENIYAGPHGATVPKSWRTWDGHRSEMMGAGFVVVKIDGRGTNFRGREFQQFAYKNLRDSGFPDRIKWMEEAARERPWMDLSRVGLYGGSAGGQSTLAGLLWHGEFYRAGAADCGCHDNRMDKIWWNEQWLGWPVDESYAANSNTEHIARLQGALFLTVGEVDTNVDPSSTYQVVDALIRADKDFEYYCLPNGGHGCGEAPYLRRKRVEFFQRHLGGPVARP